MATNIRCCDCWQRSLPVGRNHTFQRLVQGSTEFRFFTAAVLFPNGKREFWPAYDTFHRSDVGDLGVLNGRKKHEAEWSQRILPEYPIGKYVARIKVCDRKDRNSENILVKEEKKSFWVLPPGYQGSPGVSTVISSGDTGVFEVIENDDS